MARNTRQSITGSLARWMPVLLALVVVPALAACSSDSMSSAYLQANSAALHQGASATAQPTQFVVEPGASARTVAAQLQAEGLIKDARLFEAYVRASGLAGKLQAGTYTLSPHLTPVQIAEALLHSRPASIALTVPEGWRLEQIADGLRASGVMDGAAYRKIVETGDLSGLDAAAPDRYSFLKERPAGATLEGYLFPDTYELLVDQATPEALVRRQLDTFAERVLPRYRKYAEGTSKPLTLHQALTLASIVEREAGVDADRPMIAGVYLNRLAKGIKLDADPDGAICDGLPAADRPMVEVAGLPGGVQQGHQPVQHLPERRPAARTDCQPKPEKHRGGAQSGPARLSLLHGHRRRQRPTRFCAHLCGTSGERQALSRKMTI